MTKPDPVNVNAPTGIGPAGTVSDTQKIADEFAARVADGICEHLQQQADQGKNPYPGVDKLDYAAGFVIDYVHGDTLDKSMIKRIDKKRSVRGQFERALKQALREREFVDVPKCDMSVYGYYGRLNDCLIVVRDPEFQESFPKQLLRRIGESFVSLSYKDCPKLTV